MMTLSKLKSLKSLNLMGAKLTDGGLKAIAGLENLEQLNLHGCGAWASASRAVEAPKGTGFVACPG